MIFSYISDHFWSFLTAWPQIGAVGHSWAAQGKPTSWLRPQAAPRYCGSCTGSCSQGPKGKPWEATGTGWNWDVSATCAVVDLCWPLLVLALGKVLLVFPQQNSSLSIALKLGMERISLHYTWPLVNMKISHGPKVLSSNPKLIKLVITPSNYSYRHHKP